MDSKELHDLFEEHPREVAPQLLGCHLRVSTGLGEVTVRLTEVEAYGDAGEDPGSHAYRGQTPRNATMFGPPRHAYVYRSYGIHFCLNLVAGAEVAGGILLRAGEVVAGRQLAVDRRGGTDTGPALLSGPGRLGQGLGITLPMDGTPVTITQDEAPVSLGERADQVRFQLFSKGASSYPISSGPRVGVSGPGGGWEFPWRFWITADPTVSRYRPGKGVPADLAKKTTELFHD
ncbi:DNA-3-methyladenine glycosylase [Nesterenkonia alba]|uniref:DNA-3-methyladenine glycosylase n=1 Tax=Nesterenkonia alba TaxID=515814 RepID=UPI0003B579F1|nr:DNA-3-methyladenine glycosylase [Nesterenkonia alba]